MYSFYKNMFLLITLSTYLSCQVIFAAPIVDFQPFPGSFLSRLGDSVGDEWDDIGHKLTSSLFESLTDRELVDFDLGGNVNLSFKVKRKVYSNQDITNSYTVIDTLRVPINLPIPITSKEIGLGGGVFGLGLNLTFGANVFNIRQVSPLDISLLESTETLENQLNEAKKLADSLASEIPENEIILQEAQNAPNSPSENPSLLQRASDLAFWNTENPLRHARYSKILNLFTHPFRLPLNRERIQNFPVGEISSYGLDGSIQLGATVGWNGIDFLGHDVTGLRGGVGLSTYIEGKYKISIWKEKQNFAQVKVTRSNSDGRNVTLGSVQGRHQIFKGFVILGHKALKISERIIPFSLTLDNVHTKQFDIGYRYNLSNPKALDAYEQAVLGRFALSDQLATQSLESGANTGVEKIYTREQVSDTKANRYKMKLSFLFERTRSNVNTVSASIITLGDNEEVYLFQAVQNNQQGYDTLWNTSKSTRYSFVTTADRDRYDNGENAISLKIEGRIDDRMTNGRELREYKNEVEAATGLSNLFSLPPVYAPATNECLELRRHISEEDNKDCHPKYARYGRTSFFYHLGLNREHLEKFANYQEDKMWRAMEIAFDKKEGAWRSKLSRNIRVALNSYATVLNLPLAFLNIHIKNGSDLITANRFIKKWKQLKDIQGPENLVNEMGTLFKTIHHSKSLIKLIRFVLKDEELSYFVSLEAKKLFGHISLTGSNLANIDSLGQKVSDLINFDRQGPRANYDVNAVVKNLKVTNLNNNQVEITFNLDKTAAYVYFNVDKTAAWSRYKNLAKLIVKNDNLFSVGQNRIVINKEENDEDFKTILAKSIFTGDRSTLSIAVSNDGKKWGSTADARFIIDIDENN